MTGGSEGGDWRRGWRVVGGWKKGRPWVCSTQTLLKQRQIAGATEATALNHYFLTY